MKHLFIFVYILIFTSVVNGGTITGIRHYQYLKVRLEDRENKERFWDRVTYGGNIGLQFGTYTNIILSPAVGYILPGKIFQDKLTLGVGVTYMYSSIRFGGTKYEANIYGGRTFARYMIYQNFFTYLEHEFLNAPVYTNYNNQRQWINSIFIGGGYMLRLTSNGGIMISVLYNLSYTVLHPLYSSPWNVRIGFML